MGQHVTSSWSDSFGLDPWGFGVDDDPNARNAVAPLVGDYDPAPGTKLSRAQPLRFSVTDDQGALFTVLVAVAFSTGVAELAHDGTRFLSPYAGSTRVPVAGGYRYTLVRSGGWPAAPTVQTIPIDTAGNVG